MPDVSIPTMYLALLRAGNIEMIKYSPRVIHTICPEWPACHPQEGGWQATRPKWHIITYLVSSRPYIEICRVCKIYGRRGGAEHSIYFTNPTYFYVRSGTDQISVLFHWGPLFVYVVLRKIRKFIRTADKLTTSMLARKCDVVSCAT